MRQPTDRQRRQCEERELEDMQNLVLVAPPPELPTHCQQSRQVTQTPQHPGCMLAPGEKRPGHPQYRHTIQTFTARPVPLITHSNNRCVKTLLAHVAGLQKRLSLGASDQWQECI